MQEQEGRGRNMLEQVGEGMNIFLAKTAVPGFGSFDDWKKTEMKWKQAEQ